MGECDFCLLWNVVLWGDKMTFNHAHSCLSWLTCYLEEWHSILVKIWIHQRWEHDGRQLQTCAATLWKKGAGKICQTEPSCNLIEVPRLRYKSKVTASGLGAPLVIKHLSQEEPRVAQHDQWYWSMVSTICDNVAGDIPGHASISLVIFLWICSPHAILFVWYCSHCFPIRCSFARYDNSNWISSGDRKNAIKLCRCLAGQSSSSALQLRLIQQFWWRKYKWIHHNRTLKDLNGSLSLSSICQCQIQVHLTLVNVNIRFK